MRGTKYTILIRLFAGGHAAGDAAGDAAGVAVVLGGLPLDVPLPVGVPVLNLARAEDDEDRVEGHVDAGGDQEHDPPGRDRLLERNQIFMC